MTPGEIPAARVGSRLPRLHAGAGELDWRPQFTRHALVLAVLHGPECRVCGGYAEALNGATAAFREWDGRLLARRGEGALPSAVGPPPRVLVADRFGQVYHVSEAGERHAFPEPRELEEWLRYIAMQCPE